MCVYVLLTPLCAHSPTLLAGPSCRRVLDQLARIHDHGQAWATPEARAALPFDWPDACLPRARRSGSGTGTGAEERGVRGGGGGGGGGRSGDGGVTAAAEEESEGRAGEGEEEVGEEDEGNVFVVETGRWCGWECRNSYDAGGAIESAFGWEQAAAQAAAGGGSADQGASGWWGMGMPGATYGVERSGLSWGNEMSGR